MFRSKKKVGGVTVLDDNDNRAELFAGANSGQSPVSAQDHQATMEQLEASAIKEAQAGKDSTKRALKLATEARETGVQTAASLAAQTKQLERMGEDIEVVHDYLDKSERIIDKMSKPKIVRMFQRKKAGGKGLDKVKASKKERSARDDLREAGVDALDVERMQDGRAARNVEEAAAVTAAESEKRRHLFSKNKGDKSKPGVREIEADYSQYSEGVANVMREQDQDLDQIGDMLGDMKALATAMNNELKLQDDLINEVSDFTSETRKRTQANAKKVQNIK